MISNLPALVKQVLAFPVQMLVRFWVNHHLLDLVQRPCWRVVKGRSKSYVDKVLAGTSSVLGGWEHDTASTPAVVCNAAYLPCHFIVKARSPWLSCSTTCRTGTPLWHSSVKAHSIDSG